MNNKSGGSSLYPCSVGVTVTSEEVEVSLSVLCGHQDVDDGVGAGAEIDQDVAQQEPEVVRGISHNLKEILSSNLVVRLRVRDVTFTIVIGR